MENVLIVKEADTKFNFGEKGYLSFEHITWVSIVCSLSTAIAVIDVLCFHFELALSS